MRVEAEEILSGRRTHTSSAYLVFVALDERGQPRPVPGLVPETDVERHRQAEAKIRREHRLEAWPPVTPDPCKSGHCWCAAGASICCCPQG